MSDLVVNLRADGSQLQKSLNDAKTVLNQYKKEADGVKDVTQEQVKAFDRSVNALNKITNSSKGAAQQARSLERHIADLKLQYSQLNKTAVNSDFGKSMARSITDAERKLNSLNQLIGKTKSNLGSGLNGNIFGSIKDSISGIKSGNIDQAISSITNLKGSLTAAAGSGEGLMAALGGGGALAAGAAIAGVAIAAKEFADVAEEAIQKSAQFGKSLSELGAITGMQGKDLDNMREKVLQWANETNTNASDVAKGLAQIGGALPQLLHDADGLGMVFKASSNLAKAGVMEQTDATNALLTVMQQFDLSAEDSAKTVDILANAAQLGAADIKNVSETMQRCGTAAQMAGVNIEQTAALTEVLAAKGLKGAEAGTALRNVFTKMSTSGIDEMNPKVVGLTQALEYLRSKANDSTWMVQTFGAENSTAASIIASGIPFYNELSNGIEKTGTASQMAAQNANNLATQYANLKTQWDNFLSSFNVDNADGSLREIVTSCSNFITAIGEMVDSVQHIDIINDAFGSLGETVSTIIEILNSIITIVSDVIGCIGDILNPVTSANNGFDSLTKTLKLFKEILELVEMTVTALRIMIRKLIDVVVDFKNKVMESVGNIPIFEKIKEYINKVKGWINEVIKAWNKLKSIIKEQRDGMNNSSQGSGWDVNEKNPPNPTEKKKNSKNGDTESKPTKNAGLSLNEVKEEKSKLEKKYNEARSQRERDKLKKQIDALDTKIKKMSGDSAKGNGKTKSTSRSSKENKSLDSLIKAENDYASEINTIAERRKYDNDKESKYIDDEIKAIEKLRDSYIKIANKSDSQKRRIDELNQALLNAKNRYDAAKDQEMFSDTTNKLFTELNDATRKLTDGFISDEEYNNKYRNALQSVITELYKIKSLSDEQKKALSTYIKELKDFDAQKVSDEMTKQRKDSEVTMSFKKQLFDNTMAGNPQPNADFENDFTQSRKIVSLVQTLIDLQKDILERSNSTIPLNAEAIEGELTTSQMQQSFKELGIDIVSAIRRHRNDLQYEKEDGSYGKYYQDFPDDEKGSGSFELVNKLAKQLTDRLSKLKNNNKGDLSNYSLDQTSYQELQTKVNLKIQGVELTGMEKLQTELQDKLQKYADAEKIQIEENQLAKSVGVENSDEYQRLYDEQKQAMENLESEITSISERIQEKMVFKMRMEGISEGLSMLQSVGNCIQTWSNLSKTIENSENDFDAFMSVFSAVISTFETAKGVIESVDAITSLFAAKTVATTTAEEAVTVAKTEDAAATDALAASEVALGAAAAASTTAQATAAAAAIPSLIASAEALRIYTSTENTAAYAGIPFIGAAMAGAAQAAYTAMWAAAAIPMFANGGIIQGASTIGDYNIARVNSGEMILNGSQQAKLFGLLDSNGGVSNSVGGGQVDFVIRGSDLYGTLKNYGKTTPSGIKF